MSIENVFISLMLLCLYMAPLAIIAGSKRTRGHEKTAWLFAAILLSWFTLLCYFLVVLHPNDRKKRQQQNQQQLQQQQEKARQLARLKQMQTEILKTKAELPPQVKSKPAESESPEPLTKDNEDHNEPRP